MSKFKVGDRVAVYSGSLYSGHAGEIICVLQTGELSVDVGDLDYLIVRPQQCRKLVKKKRRRVSVNPAFINAVSESTLTIWRPYPVPGWIEFVEVRKKK